MVVRLHMATDSMTRCPAPRCKAERSDDILQGHGATQLCVAHLHTITGNSSELIGQGPIPERFHCTERQGPSHLAMGLASGTPQASDDDSADGMTLSSLCDSQPWCVRGFPKLWWAVCLHNALCNGRVRSSPGGARVKKPTEVGTHRPGVGGHVAHVHDQHACMKTQKITVWFTLLTYHCSDAASPAHDQQRPDGQQHALLHQEDRLQQFAHGRRRERLQQ